MGVKDLWSILEPVKNTCQLDDLAGTSVAVDLGFWICQMNSAVEDHVATQYKIHLRNLFFRIHALLKRNIKPIFISEGKPPEIKYETIRSRLDSRNNGSQENKLKPKIFNRSRFNRLLKESCELVQLMGLNYFQSDGEAEALCAALNAQGVVDAVITDDSDAFLYGAKRVYKNFNLDGKQPTMDSYCIDDIETKLQLNRCKMIALALLLGCDYCPKGVPGVGKERSLKFLQNVPLNDNILERFRRWKDNDVENQSFDHEAYIKGRALQINDFPQCKIIEEYLRPRDPVDIFKLPLDLNFTLLRTFLSQKLEWEDEYIVDKIVPIFTLKHLRAKAENPANDSILKMEVVQIVKRRIKSGQACFEIRWSKFDEDIWTEKDNYTTIECEKMFTLAYPEMVDEFVNNSLKPKTKKTGIKTTKNKIETKNENSFNEMVTNDQVTDEIDFSKLSFKESDPASQLISERKNVDGVNSTMTEERKPSKFTFRKIDALKKLAPPAPEKETQNTPENSPLPFRERVARLLQKKTVDC